MKNKCCSLKRIVSLMILLAMLLSCAPAMAEGYSAVVNQSSVGVYSDAKMTKSAGTLSGYTVVTVLSVDGTVAKIRCGGFTLYTDLYALTKVSDFAIPAEFNAATFVFQDPDVTSRSVTVKAGMLVNVLAVSGNWAMIERNGYAGFTYKGYLTPVTTADDENAADPFLPQETPDNTIQGTNQVTIDTISAVVSTTSLPVYKSASTSSSKLGTLKSGQAVTIHAYNDAWAYISLNGKYGFCKLAGLQKTGTVIVNPDNDINDVKSKPAKVTAESVVVYSKANTSSKNRLGTLKKGTVVNLVKTSTNWAYIELNGHYGYCALSALTVADEGTSNAGMTALGTATVITPTAKVYTSASTNANYTTVPIGTTYSFYSYDSAWVMVGLSENNFAYIPISCLNAESYAELKNEDSGAAVTALQSALLALGYFDGVPSTNYAADTTAAVKRLQAACGMAQTGEANIATLRVLYSGNAPKSPILSLSLSSGMNNDNVMRLQSRLYALDYLSRESSIDGDYGSKTSAAVSLFQKACGFTATGTADNKTILALYHASAPALASDKTAADAASTGTTTNNSTISVVSDQPSGNSTSISSKLASTTKSYSSSMSNAQKLEYVIYNAQLQLGKRYVYGAAGTATFDCSGLTLYCFGKIGISMPHSAYSQGYNNKYTKISSTSGLKRGDCVFFNTVSDGDMCDHVGIALGNSYFIHASSGAAKVVVSSLASGYYNRVFSWGRRILG